MFTERLQLVKDRIAGSTTLSLVAKDGIPVESVGESVLDLETLAAELMSQVRAVSQNHQEISVGKVRQFSVTTDRFTLMVGSLTTDYFLMMVLQPGANYGRARFELRRAVTMFEDDLL